MQERRITICLVLVALVVVLNLPVPAGLRIKAGVRDSLAPFQNVMSLVVYQGRLVVGMFRTARTAAEERRLTLETMAALRYEVRRLRTLEGENEKLRGQLGFMARQKHKLAMCEVIARGDASGWWQTVTLNRGSRHGVQPDLPVISADGLIGRTVEVSRNTCSVLLLTDPNCQVSCRFSRTRAFGIVRGMGVSAMGQRGIEMLSPVRPARMAYVPRDAVISDGDAVVTSGLGGVYPEGLLVGYVVSSDLDESGMYRQAQIRPAADMGALRYAFVLLAPASETEEDG